MEYNHREQARIEKLMAKIEQQRAEIERLTADRANRYWEGRWRDEKAENERLTAEIKQLQARTQQ